MTRTKWLASFFGLLLFGGALTLFFSKSPLPRSGGDSTSPSGNAPSTKTPEAKAFAQGTPMKRVMDLYQMESKRVGQIDKDPKATQTRLEQDARELNPEEIGWLFAQAEDAKNDADARFFAAYLLGLSHKDASVGALERLALLPLPVSKHERYVEQERVFRASAVEGLSHNCKDFPGPVKDALLNIVSNQTDEFLRDRAHRGLYTCETGKPIEEQDKEALEKLRSKK